MFLFIVIIINIMKCDHNDAGDDEDPCFEPTQPQHIPLQTCSCAQIKDMTRHLVMRFGRMMDTNSETEEIEWLANSAVAGYTDDYRFVSPKA